MKAFYMPADAGKEEEKEEAFTAEAQRHRDEKKTGRRKKLSKDEHR
jgi:hypothetical protein